MSAPGNPTEGAVVPCGVVRYERGAPASSADRLAVEEPLEIRIAGEPLVVTMRTPGHDQELCAGLLFAEGILRGPRDIGSMAHCGRPGEEGHGNTIDLVPAAGLSLDLERISPSRRGTLTTSACGVCGRRTIDDLLSRCRPVDDPVRFPATVIAALPDQLRAAQHVFDETGGLHAAGLADDRGRLLVVREDVGRHNAVDKVVGRLLLDGALPARGRAVIVSGRASFEIVQKAVAANIGLVVSVSAPSSLAVRTAERAGVTLVGFARVGSFNVYVHPERIV